MLAVLCVSAALVAGCGAGSRQDADEPKGKFPVQVVSATFPHAQRLAKDSKLTIMVRNTGTKRVPDISVTIKCPGQRNPGEGFNYRTSFPGVADPSRPQFEVNTIPTRTPRNYDQGRLDPLERSSAYVATYPLGPLAAGRTATFTWDVTAVKSGPYRICWQVNAGLDGKAKAVPSQAGERINGEFKGTVNGVAPDARIADDGHTVVESAPGTK